MVKRAVALLGACHPGPAFAVTLLAGLLAGAVGLGPGRVALVVAAVLTGQLSIGWSNDLVDLARDRAVGREDKPLVDGRVSERAVRIACALAVVATVPLSLACGWLAGLVHLVCVAAGWAYNLGRQVDARGRGCPYAVAFGGLPVFVSLTDDPDQLPPLWLPLAGALLGVGAHFVNVLPDLADDAATGVRGLPHRLGARWSPVVAAAVLVAAAVVIVVGAPVDSGVVAAAALLADRRAGRGRAARARAGAVPGRDRDGAGRRGHAGVGAMTESWDLVVVGAGPAGATDRAGRAARRPVAAGAAARPLRLPARQVLRRRHRAALLRAARLDRRHRRRGRLDAADPARARPRRRSRWPGRWPGRCTSSRGRSSTPGWSSGRSTAAPPSAASGSPRSDAAPRRRPWSSAPTAPTRWSARHLGLPYGRRALAIRGYAPTPPDRRGTQVIRYGDRRQPAYAWAFDRGDGLSNVGYGELLPGRRRG